MECTKNKHGSCLCFAFFKQQEKWHEFVTGCQQEIRKDWKHWILFLPAFCSKGANIIFNHIFSHSASFFPPLERTDIFQCSSSIQLAAGHFRPRVQTCHRLCSDQLNECTQPTEPAPLKAHRRPLTIQSFRLCGFFNICKAEAVIRFFQSFCK